MCARGIGGNGGISGIDGMGGIGGLGGIGVSVLSVVFLPQHSSLLQLWYPGSSGNAVPNLQLLPHNNFLQLW